VQQLAVDELEERRVLVGVKEERHRLPREGGVGFQHQELGYQGHELMRESFLLFLLFKLLTDRIRAISVHVN
jgi:hypothetical protein